MFANVSERITNNLEQNKVIKPEERELYLYGFEQGLTLLLNALTTLVVGLIFGKLLYAILFMAFYIPLRSYAGGYHARTPFRCYLISIAIIIALCMLLKYLVLNNIVYCILSLVSALTIIIFSPVEDANKPLDEKEVIVYRRRTLIILSIEIIIALIMFLLNWSQYLLCFVYSLFVLSVMLILGKILRK